MRNKKEIAKALNDDFQKVYFATKSSGEIVELYEMTYAEMLNRMISLMYVVNFRDFFQRTLPNLTINLSKCTLQHRYVPERWLDVTYRDMVQRMLQRVHERFCTTSSSDVLDLSSTTSKEKNPMKRVKTYLDNVVSLSKTQLVRGVRV